MNQLVFQTTVTGPELQPLLDSIQRSNWADSGDWVLLLGISKTSSDIKFITGQLALDDEGDFYIPENFVGVEDHMPVTLTILTSFKKILRQPD